MSFWANAEHCATSVYGFSGAKDSPYIPPEYMYREPGEALHYGKDMFIHLVSTALEVPGNRTRDCAHAKEKILEPPMHLAGYQRHSHDDLKKTTRSQ